MALIQKRKQFMNFGEHIFTVIQSISKKMKYAKLSFIEKAKQVHGEKYDYSKVEYVSAKENIVIVCSLHGEFKQTPNNHLKGKGCSKCNGGVKLTKNDFIH